MAKHSHTQETGSGSRRALGAFTGVLFSLALAVTLFAAGFAVCTLQPTTALLSRLFSDFNTSVYLPDDTVDLAVATRDFTVEPYRNGQDAAIEILASRVLQAAAHSAAPTSLKAPYWKQIALPALDIQESSFEEAPVEAESSEQESQTLSLDLRKEGTYASQNTGADATGLADATPAAYAMYALASQGAAYALGPDEISHLIDCNKLIGTAIPILVVIAVVALLCGIATFLLASRRTLGTAFAAAPILLVTALLAIGIWAFVDFQGFFAAFHGLFFPQGNWTFPYDSLLICMLPTPFWIGMLVIWISTTIVLSLVAIAIGRRLR